MDETRAILTLDYSNEIQNELRDAVRRLRRIQDMAQSGADLYEIYGEAYVSPRKQALVSELTKGEA